MLCKISLAFLLSISATASSNANEMTPQELLDSAKFCPDAPLRDSGKVQERLDCLSWLSGCVEKGFTHSVVQLKKCLDKAAKTAPPK